MAIFFILSFKATSPGHGDAGLVELLPSQQRSLGFVIKVGAEALNTDEVDCVQHLLPKHEHDISSDERRGEHVARCACHQDLALGGSPSVVMRSQKMAVDDVNNLVECRDQVVGIDVYIAVGNVKRLGCGVDAGEIHGSSRVTDHDKHGDGLSLQEVMIPNGACRAQKEVVENELAFSAHLISPAYGAICRFLQPVAGDDVVFLEGEFGRVDKVI